MEQLHHRRRKDSGLRMTVWLAAKWAQLITWLRARLRGAAVRREIDRELAYHLEMKARELESAGSSTAAAHREAHQQFGDFERIRAECHRILSVETSRRRDTTIMSEFLQDLYFTIRSLRRAPSFTFVVVATLALGIGANAAIFSIVDAVLLRPLPYHESGNLFRLWQADRVNGAQFEGFSLPDFYDVKERNRVFTDLAATRVPSFTLTGDDAEPMQVFGVTATHDLFSVLGVSPVLGRGFLPEEDVPGGDRVTILSHGFWTSRFGADEGVLERSIVLDGQSYRVIGVMGPSFAYPTSAAELWLPMQLGPTGSPRGNHGFGVVARLAPRVTPQEAAANLSSIALALEEEYAGDNAGRGMWPQPITESVVGNVRPALLVLLGTVGIVLLIACVNVANLLFARGATREREVAVRVALGANRRRLFRQFLTESAVLATLGGAAGLSIAYAALRAFQVMAPVFLPRQADIGLDGRVIGFTVAISLVTGAVFGTFPALQSSRPDLQTPLREGGRGAGAGYARERVRRTLVVLEVAMAVMLASGAGLLIKSFWGLTRVDPGYDAEGVLHASLQLPASRYPQRLDDWPNYPEVHGFHGELIERLRSIPGAAQATLALNAPTSPGWTTRFQIEGRPPMSIGEQEEIRIRPTTSGYTETVRIPLVRGRSLTPGDDRPDGPPVTLINRAMAERYFADEDPIGQRLINWGVAREIVGVIDDVRFLGLNQPVPPAAYPAMVSMPFSGFSVLVRAAGDPMSLLPHVRRHVGELDRELALTNIATIDGMLATTVSQPRFNMVLMGLFGAVALTLAAVGIYGVISYGVNQKTHEIGVRMSIGASAGNVVAQIMRQGVGLAAAGIVLGLVGTMVLSRTLSTMLFGVGGTDAPTFTAVAVVVSAVSAAASFVPARRASRVDPMVALRTD